MNDPDPNPAWLDVTVGVVWMVPLILITGAAFLFDGTGAACFNCFCILIGTLIPFIAGFAHKSGLVALGAGMTWVILLSLWWFYFVPRVFLV